MKSSFRIRRHAYRTVFLGLAVGLAALATGCGPRADETAMDDFELPPDLMAGPAPNTDTEDAEAAVVTVDGTAITRGELDEAVDRLFASHGITDQVPPDQRIALRDQVAGEVLDQLIARHLLLAASVEAGVEVDPEEIERFRARIRESLPEGVTLDEMLASQGLTSEGLEDGIVKDMRIQQYLARISEDLPPIGEDEARAFYEEHAGRFEIPENARARHILVAFGEDDDEEQRQVRRIRAERIRQRILEGADFAEMAAEHSDCDSRRQGGDLGRFPRGRMTPAFEEAVFTREIDEIGPPVQTEFGYHVVQVTAREEGRTLSFDEVREQIEYNLAETREREAFLKRLEELREAATIVYPED